MIVFVHLLNDRSGSPRMLKSVIGSISEPCMLFVGSDGNGLLDEVPCAIRTYWYRRSSSRWLTLVTFLASQVALFAALVQARLPKDALIYVNTLLPFGAAVYGRLTGRRVIYHVHEMSLSPRAFQHMLVAIARWSSTRLLYVSNAHRHLLPIAPGKEDTVPNGIDRDLAHIAASQAYHHRHAGKFVVLMLATPMPYKGIGEFMRLAESLASREDIVFLFAPGRGGYSAAVPSNVTVLSPTNDPAAYYSAASLVLNLTRPDLCVETFGLTLLEGMAFGTPVIAPPAGGPAELITDGKEGYLIDSRDDAALAGAVVQLADDEALCLRMSMAARARATEFAPEAFTRKISAVIEAARG
ncbi:glycosyltransferase [Sphingomonas koreensis]|jgi:glycosyltransferase involved in cell wall biosynthesis|uniref:Glycosyltransferase n=1 Tax=Sphingomonas koreensis TaxID=93064 RepID=A0A1L6JF43_9SPHN|nr:glycosyltransferase family 4 protein [Sphingomonas koreensis]APR54544.1 hypothetical protein BRX40_20850 [Sphingomonas koreensis]MDC7810895.1 glycosyltransferase family 4 protein [Sphingomonas koreensis]RSU20487.1 glycosyltransferase [Sphingomonas koreensis]RSU28817.1 glycosyltransferase [Sphingomonas koreensis]RSU29669.1 glycosyltransferase [Sphingomonas koreensis]